MRKFFSVFLILVGVSLLGYGGYLYYQNIDDTEDKNIVDNNGDNKQLTEDEIAAKKLKDLYDKYFFELGFSSDTTLEYFKKMPHSTSKVTYKDLEKTYILEVALKNIDENNELLVYFDNEDPVQIVPKVKVPFTLINDTIQQLYGNVTQLTAPEFNSLLEERMYTSQFKGFDLPVEYTCPPQVESVGKIEGNNIICMESRMSGPYFGTWVVTRSKLVKAEENENNIYLYDVFLLEMKDKCYSSLTKELTLEEGERCYFDSYPINKYDDLQTYKHTFIKNSDGSYTYVSSEPVNE